MADRHFRELLRKHQAENTIDTSIALFSLGQRLGFSLVDYRDYGVSWQTVKENLWQLNSVFLDQYEVIKYKKHLRETTNWHPKFFEPKRVFAHATGYWHPI
jgi:hypothetical protein